MAPESIGPALRTAPELGEILPRLQKGAVRLARLDWRQRVSLLEDLERSIDRNIPVIQQALQKDLGKPPEETLVTEIYALYAEIGEVKRRLEGWMRPRKVRTPIAWAGAESYIQWQPKGVILVISPWNFPFQLTLGPLISAIAAGNAVCLKPSESSPATSRVLKDLVEEVFAPDEVALIEGAGDVAESLTRLPFDHLIFTGSPRVGRQVLRAAATNLTPATLELGGKSPAILTPDADLRKAASRLAWGKFLNSGQTCVAPDYVLVPRRQEQEFLRLVVEACRRNWPGRGDSQGPSDYSRIVNPAHFERLEKLFEEALSEGAELVDGGRRNRARLWFEPTVLRNVSAASRLLCEEIFGPLLPVVSYEKVQEALDFVNLRPRPLALYIFSQDDSLIQRIIDSTRAGDTVVNDVLIHFANPRLPFGGIGRSGMGKLHGRFGFQSCSHQRGVMKQGPVSSSHWIAPPYTARVGRLIRWLLKLV